MNQDHTYADYCECEHLRVNHRDGQCFGRVFTDTNLYGPNRVRVSDRCRCKEFALAMSHPEGPTDFIAQTAPEAFLQQELARVEAELAEARRERDEAQRVSGYKASKATFDFMMSEVDDLATQLARANAVVERVANFCSVTREKVCDHGGKTWDECDLCRHLHIVEGLARGTEPMTAMALRSILNTPTEGEK